MVKKFDKFIDNYKKRRIQLNFKCFNFKGLKIEESKFLMLKITIT